VPNDDDDDDDDDDIQILVNLLHFSAIFRKVFNQDKYVTG
jgi:hypothetical protein